MSKKENAKQKEKKVRTKWKDLPVEVRKKKRKRYIIIAVIILIVVFWGVSKVAAANVKYPVSVVDVTRMDVESTIATSGTVKSDDSKTYYSQISGTVGEVVVQTGQTVKAGDVLLHFSKESLDVANMEAQAAALSSESAYNDTMNQNAKTQARLTEATVNLEVLNQQITDYEAFIKEQERKLEDKRNAKRAGLSALGMELSKKQAAGEDVAEEMAEYQYCVETLDLSQELVDIQRTIDDAREILSNLEEYKAEMKSQHAATEDSVLSVATKEAKTMSKDAEQMKNNQMMEYMQSVENGLKADADGIVTDITVTEGAPITSGAALVTIAGNEQVHVAINLSKTDLAKVKEGQKADVTIAGKKYEGEVSFINHMATTNSQNMPVVEAQIRIINADEDIYLGIEAKVVIYSEKSENTLVVPVEVVNSDKNGDFVYIVEDGIVVRKDVVTGISSDAYIEILEGIKESDRVMTDISIDITEGMEVMVMTDMSEEAEGEPSKMSSLEISIESE